jgi:PAS domain S-box-containing protein
MTDISQLEAYRELEETEQYWRTIFDSSSEAMAVFTSDGRHLDVNPAWEKLTGYSKQEALSTSFSVENILDAEAAATLRKSLNQSDQAILEQTIHARNGQDRIIKASIQRLPVQKNNQPSYILVAADITTLKEREAELAQTISYTERLLENLAAGNLTLDDTTKLMGAAKRIQMRYNTAIAALGELVGKIRQIAEQVKHASHELASGQRDLAQRIEQEAASLQEIAASLEEITTSTTETSKNARESTDFAQKIAQEAKDGQASMEKLLALMESIYHQAQRTTRILSTITDIAFQTNILSLNASVEAARAGIDGRGFAVIATEIRNLANKVSAETRQIDDWLKSLLDETRLGKEAIADNTAKVQGIADGAKEVANRMNVISEAALDTDKGIHQIQETIAVLEQGVQQSAAMVEEVSTAADTLLQQAGEMSSAVDAFSTNTDTKPQPLVASVDSQAIRAKPSHPSRFPKTSKTLHLTRKKPVTDKANNEWEEF